MEHRLKIRKATKKDVPEIYEMIKELAVYEKEPDAVDTTPQQLLDDGFGADPHFHVLIATVDEKTAGMAFYYFAYSTWKGRFLYLEDLVVKQTYRRQGVGSLLMDALFEEARASGVSRMGWQVLDWNDSAINFYKKLGAEINEGWLNVRVWV